jgi:hypothetical protein
MHNPHFETKVLKKSKYRECRASYGVPWVGSCSALPSYFYYPAITPGLLANHESMRLPVRWWLWIHE